MAMSNRVQFAPVNREDKAVAFHGGTGVVHGRRRVGSRWRRPAALSAGYQRTGSDVIPSRITVWKACATQDEARLAREAVESLAYGAYKLTYREHAGTPVVVTEVEVSRIVATRGPIVTGTTRATYRVEATITLEVTA